MRNICILVAALLISVGCASVRVQQPTQQDLAAADCGAYPTNYQAIVKGYINANFKDPYSIQDLAIQEPQRGVVTTQDPLIKGAAIYNVFGYNVKYSLNAKNSYGAYTGLRNYSVWIRDGQVFESDLTLR